MTARRRILGCRGRCRRPSRPRARRSASPASAGRSVAARSTRRRSARCAPGRSPWSPTTAYPCTSRSTSSTRACASRASPLTLVFCHGYALNLDCWHFQRAAYRGLVRAVYYDQRSHGRSGRSTEGHATIDQLGRDLEAVLDAVVPDGPVVLVGHSMGGMTIVAFTEQHPELIGDRVVGVGLISTTAGGLDPSRILLPMLPAKLGGELTHRTVRTLARGHRLIDGVRRVGHAVAMVGTDLFAFGDEVPAAYVDFVDEMLSADAVRGGRRVLPELQGPRQVPRGRRRWPGSRPRSSAAPPTG